MTSGLGQHHSISHATTSHNIQCAHCISFKTGTTTSHNWCPQPFSSTCIALSLGELFMMVHCHCMYDINYHILELTPWIGMPWGLSIGSAGNMGKRTKPCLTGLDVGQRTQQRIRINCHACKTCSHKTTDHKQHDNGAMPGIHLSWVGSP
jgi:hypothetical protein